MDGVAKSTSSILSELVNNVLSTLNNKKNEDLNRKDLTKFQETLNGMIEDEKIAPEIKLPVVKENIDELLKKL